MPHIVGRHIAYTRTHNPASAGVEISIPMMPHPYPVFLHSCLCYGGSDNVEAILVTRVSSEAFHCLDVNVWFQDVFGCYFEHFGVWIDFDSHPCSSLVFLQPRWCFALNLEDIMIFA